MLARNGEILLFLQTMSEKKTRAGQAVLPEVAYAEHAILAKWVTRHDPEVLYDRARDYGDTLSEAVALYAMTRCDSVVFEEKTTRERESAAFFLQQAMYDTKTILQPYISDQIVRGRAETFVRHPETSRTIGALSLRRPHDMRTIIANVNSGRSDVYGLNSSRTHLTYDEERLTPDKIFGCPFSGRPIFGEVSQFTGELLIVEAFGKKSSL